MTEQFDDSNGRFVVEAMIATIHENRAYLSEIDGAIGDGDHGINMDKGFLLAQETIAARVSHDEAVGLADSLRVLGKTLLMDIGGSMGPLYGKMFRAMAAESTDHETIDLATVVSMLESALDAVVEIGGAGPGDKTLVDTLAPAVAAIRDALDAGDNLSAALEKMIRAAEQGWRSTEQMVAQVGRAARLGERSRGTLDAGATSCYLLLKAMGDSISGFGSAASNGGTGVPS